MKNRFLTNIFLSALSVAALNVVSLTKLSATAESSETGSLQAEQPPTIATTSAARSKAGQDATVTQWNEIKDYSYDMRATFFAGLRQLESKVDGQINDLKTRRAAMTSATDNKAWDFAMKEMADARSFLKSVGQEIGKANIETWSQQKEAVGRAWERSQTAYDKVKSSAGS